MQDLNPYIVSSDRNPLLAQRINFMLGLINQRLNDLEYHQNKKRKAPQLTRAQKMLAMEILGVLDIFRALGTSNKKLAVMLSLLIDASPDNIEGDLSDILNPKSALKTKKNLEVLKTTFEEGGLKEKVAEVETLLKNLKT